MQGEGRFAARDDVGALRCYAEGLAKLEGSGSGDSSLLAALHGNSAQVLLRQRRWLEAIEHCNAALRSDPGHVKAAWRGASAALEVGMRDVAISFLEGALDMNPDCEELLALRAKLGPLPDGHDEHGEVEGDDLPA
eukprot:CAMPEP_0180571706 /NCGR_PEP_ID=MMETSP1037_2-20121125/8859_1 /TAXON_ID=632150 /ORGANISM="Azadinium spinosum, Strain 3D9" /LENGTH=135 /DNA_ID=CAMNT_0022589035 /DNA_START=41 /DNA_END=445 /DNA_ORIENTATION=+